MFGVWVLKTELGALVIRISSYSIPLMKVEVESVTDVSLSCIAQPYIANYGASGMAESASTKRKRFCGSWLTVLLVMC